MRLVFVCLALALLSLVCPSQALQFSLRSGEETCIGDDILKGELILGEFKINPPNSRVWVVLKDPSNSVVYSKMATGDGKFAHTPAMNGEYKGCFNNNEGVQQKTIEFEFKTGAQAKDYSQLAKKENLKPLEVELKRMEDMIDHIQEEMDHMSAREREIRAMNETQSARVVYLSVFSMLVLVALLGSQTVYLKRFFQSKKIID